MDLASPSFDGDVSPEQVPERYRLGPAFVPKGRYLDREFLEMELELLFPKTWLMACRLEELPSIGNYVEYRIGDRSVLVVREGPDSIRAYHNACRHRGTRLAEGRLALERRAEEVLSQEDLAPKRWAERLAPETVPDISGFEIGRLYHPGTGMMAGDFYDVYRVAPTRVAAVIGDVTGHGIDPSITAFQAKYLLRVFLRQFRDPAQALEELNAQMSQADRGEEMISLCVVVFDTEASTVRYASAGHPPAWMWHAKDVQPLRATGPLLLLDPAGTYHSRELRLDSGDVVLLYTDGLSEARSGDEQFGEERIASVLRRDPGAEPGVLVKSLLDTARDFASQAITDDIAIVAMRRA